MTLPTTKLDLEIADSFSKRLGQKRSLPFDQFINWALYDPKIGYYNKKKKRVGKSIRSDFYTSTSFGKLWSKLVIETCVKLIGRDKVAQYSFIEIAAEPESSLLDSIEHPFRSQKVFRLGESIVLPPLCIIYSNEWLDAQPFKRFSYSNEKNQWMEHGVTLQNLCLDEVILENNEHAFDFQLSHDSIDTSDGYLVDWPIGAEKALRQLVVGSDWEGLFLTFDYGLSLNSIFHEYPSGTARSYKNHKVSNNLLQNPGEQDITCSLCWDILKTIMKDAGFQKIKVESQENFLIKHCSETLKEIIEEKNSFEKNALKELIHPLHMGHKFQALWGFRYS